MDIPVAYHFQVDFVPLADPFHIRFQQVSGLSTELITRNVKQGIKTCPVAQGVRHGNLVLKRGMATGSLVSNMFNAAMTTLRYRKVTVMVTLLNDESLPLASWWFLGAAPKKWSMDDFNAGSNSLVIERMEFTYQKLLVFKK